MIQSAIQSMEDEYEAVQDLKKKQTGGFKLDLKSMIGRGKGR